MEDDLERFVETPRLRPQTQALYRRCVREFLAYADRDPHRWSFRTVEDWMSTLLARGLQPQSVNIFRKAVCFASRRRAKYLACEDFAVKVDKLRPSKNPHKPVLEEDEVFALLKACDGPKLRDLRDRTLILVALRTGLRRGGLLALDVEGIQGSKITTVDKGGSMLSFEADDETIDMLSDWLEASGIGSGAVFRNVRGDKINERMTDFQIWYVFKERAKKAGLRHIHPHLLRHTTVTWLREAGVSSADVRTLTGQSEKTIENIYTHMRRRGPIGAKLPKLT
jgi:integrase